MAAFSDFAQYPQFGATFAGNAARIVAALGRRIPPYFLADLTSTFDPEVAKCVRTPGR